MTGLYHGLKVIEFGQLIAGPHCGRLLADNGADVIKVEPLSGDEMRRVPIVLGAELSTGFIEHNCGKRSIAIDLDQSAGQTIARKLITDADVVIENMKPGALTRRGLGYADLVGLQPSLIFCSISLFGSFGAYAGETGMGMVAEARSGFLSQIRGNDGRPHLAGMPLADMAGALHAFGAIGAALYRAEKTHQGGHIDISVYDAIFSLIRPAPAMLASSNIQLENTPGGTALAAVPSGIYRTADEQDLAIIVVGQSAWERLNDAMGEACLRDRPEYATADLRIANRAALVLEIADWLVKVSAADAIQRLTDHQIGVEVIRDLRAVLGDSHLRDRGTLRCIEVNDDRRAWIQAAPHVVDGIGSQIVGPAPRIGQHTSEILRERLGLSSQEVSDLTLSGTVGLRGTGQ